LRSVGRKPGRRALSLRLRLIGLVALVFAASLALGGTLACFNARRSVEAEMRSALAVGRQTVALAVAGLDRSDDPTGDLERLVASFRDNRHLRASLSNRQSTEVVPRREAASLSAAPRWFERLIGVRPSRLQVPVAVGGRDYGEIVLETVPHNEILEIWNEFGDSLLLLALFSVPTMLLIYVFIGRALRPLDRLAQGFARIGGGDYAVRVEESLPPELSRLRDSFNLMATRLAGMAAENRGLAEQLLNLQEQERVELARDLHDEIGPFLFAINIDAAAVARQAESGRLPAIAGPAAAIGEAVAHLQQQVKSMLGRLRPIGLAEFGLGAAIANLIEFWRRRHPEIDFRLEIAPEAEGKGELIDTTIYRMVQECLANALRHGKPSTVAILLSHACGEQGDGLVLTVRDDGSGMSARPRAGYGLLGMGERVKALGGSFEVASDPGAGLAVTARLPLPARERAEAL
jgi:two-component system, NarL family, sensor histidine kinase UhpB